MNLNINGKDTELRFDVGFIRRLDEVYKIENKSQGIQFGMGLMSANIYLKQFSPPALSDIIRCAIKPTPSQVTIDKFIEDYADKHGDLDQLFTDVSDALGKSNVCKATLKNLQKLADKQAKE